MSKSALALIIALSLASILLAGCSNTSSVADIPENAALKITGSVKKQVGWTEEQVQAMDTIEAESINKKGETKTYTGVPVNNLLDLAGVEQEATAITYVNDAGDTADVALAEVQACDDCIISFRNQGGFSVVMPGFPNDVQLKGVVEIQVR